MLKSIKIKNFYSFGEEQEISFEISSKDALDDSARHHKSGNYLNTVACIIGSNASGKTNALRALSFLAWFIETSYSFSKTDQYIPLALHKLHSKGATSFEIEFYENDVLYRYYIQLNQRRVLKERLDKKEKRINKTPVFELIRDSKGVKITTKSLAINENDQRRIEERGNVSLLSALIDLGYLPEITFFKNIRTNVMHDGLMYGAVPSFIRSSIVNTSQVLYNDKELQKDLLSFSKTIDLGITDFSFEKIESLNPKSLEVTQMLRCTHASKNGNFTLPIFYESNGTQRSFSIISDTLLALRTRSIVIIDEIEDGLHPDVIKRIISLFESKETNKHNSQLIFSTHQHLLLNDRTKTQIFFANKDYDSFETEIYRLDDVEGVRNDENYFHKYMAGVYGSTPNIKWI